MAVAQRGFQATARRVGRSFCLIVRGRGYAMRTPWRREREPPVNPPTPGPRKGVPNQPGPTLALMNPVISAQAAALASAKSAALRSKKLCGAPS